MIKKLSTNPISRKDKKEVECNVYTFRGLPEGICVEGLRRFKALSINLEQVGYDSYVSKMLNLRLSERKKNIVAKSKKFSFSKRCKKRRDVKRMADLPEGISIEELRRFKALNTSPEEVGFGFYVKKMLAVRIP